MTSMVRSPFSMLVIGLTGGIGSGKSTVAGALVERGAVLIDSDRIVREVQEPAGPAFQPIVDRFGNAVVAEDGTLDRQAIADIVFADEDARRDLQAITWPLVGQVTAQRMAEQAGTDNVVVLDIPLLAEGAKERYGMAGVIVVDVPEDVQVARLVQYRGMDEDEARRRMKAQMSRADRLKVADFVVDNSGSLEDLAAEVGRAWAWIESLRSAGDHARS